MNQAVVDQPRRNAIAALLHATHPPARLSRAAWTADVVLAAVLAVSTVTYLLKARNQVLQPDKVPVPPVRGLIPPHLEQHVTVGPGQLILAVLAALPLALRRRYPLAAFWAVLVAALALQSQVSDANTALLTFASCLIAAYSAAVYSPYRAAAIASVALGAALLGVRHEHNLPEISAGFVPFVVVLGLGLVANTIHIWKQRLAALQAAHDQATRQAVEQERRRIAAELHDVVTHNVAVMVVQAGAARKVIDKAPAQARDALLAVEAGGRAALTELRHVMGLLTIADGGHPAAAEELDPQPGLGQLAALTDRVRATGVRLDVAVTGDPVPLTPGVDLAAYRVVQEGLTNALKHAAGSSVRVALAYGPDALRVEVSDTGGVSTAPAHAGSGSGLAGLRARLALYGASLQTCVLPTGGFRVRADIPIEQP